MAQERISDPVLDEQTQYYLARTAESDDWFYRRGRWDHGSAHNRQWFREAVELMQALSAFEPRGNLLELAAGSGFWTQRLVLTADHVTVVDISPGALESNRVRLGPMASRVRYIEADLFDWRATEKYDVIFFAFWLSHVPADRFVEFWAGIEACLAPQGRIFLLETLPARLAYSAGAGTPDPSKTVMVRKYQGREYRVYKHYHTPNELNARLRELGWNAELRATPEFFLYGPVRRAR